MKETVTTLKELERIFGAPKTETFVTASKVLTSPSDVSRELAMQAIQSMNLATVLRDLGAIAAGKIADDLSAMSLKAADYATLPDMPEMVATLLAAAIAKAPTEFTAALIEHLLLRG